MLDDDTKKTIQGAYSRFLEAKGLQPRYGQKLMIAEVARTLGNIELDSEGQRQNTGHICVIEAGTGTGKTVAYLLATIAVAQALEKKVVIATATVALQEQVVFKDLPEIIRHSGLKFSYSLAKGRGRYLCLSKLDRILSSKDESDFIPVYEDDGGIISDSDSRLYDEMMEKLSQGKWDGDRDSWEEEVEHGSWQRVTTDHRQCTGRKCSNVRSCAFFKAREELDDADCVVANHDLVLADIALGGGAILPPQSESIYIFDEGHHLPGKALNHFSNHARYKSTIRWLGQSEGQWPSLLATVEEASYFVQLSHPLESGLKHVRSIMENGLHILQDLTMTVDRSEMTPRLRFEQGVVPDNLEVLAMQLKTAFADLHLLLEKLHKELDQLLAEDYPAVPRVDLENLFTVMGSWVARSNACYELWDSYAHTKLDEAWPIARWITLVEFNDIVDFEMVSSPILASRALQNDLWSKCCGAVVTSATLTALNSFDRFKYRAGTYDDSCYAVVPSPFNYSENAVLAIPQGAVEANNAQLHTDTLIDLLPNLLQQDQGSLVLFSSRRQMYDVYEDMPSEVKTMVLMQGIESKQALLKKHRTRIDNQIGSVIFGLASFAEGVDLPGKYCEHVIIAKIPFAVPDDPLEAALAEWIEARGGNAFMQITVPDASTRLIQACGRLLRTEKDSGRVTILDRRLLTKRYGTAILQSLPPFRHEFG